MYPLSRRKRHDKYRTANLFTITIHTSKEIKTRTIKATNLTYTYTKIKYLIKSSSLAVTNIVVQIFQFFVMRTPSFAYVLFTSRLSIMKPENFRMSSRHNEVTRSRKPDIQKSSRVNDGNGFQQLVIPTLMRASL